MVCSLDMCDAKVHISTMFILYIHIHIYIISISTYILSSCLYRPVTDGSIKMPSVTGL